MSHCHTSRSMPQGGTIIVTLFVCAPLSGVLYALYWLYLALAETNRAVTSNPFSLAVGCSVFFLILLVLKIGRGPEPVLFRAPTPIPIPPVPNSPAKPRQHGMSAHPAPSLTSSDERSIHMARSRLYTPVIGRNAAPQAGYPLTHPLLTRGTRLLGRTSYTPSSASLSPPLSYTLKNNPSATPTPSPSSRLRFQPLRNADDIPGVGSGPCIPAPAYAVNRRFTPTRTRIPSPPRSSYSAHTYPPAQEPTPTSPPAPTNPPATPTPVPPSQRSDRIRPASPSLSPRRDAKRPRTLDSRPSSVGHPETGSSGTPSGVPAPALTPPTSTPPEVTPSPLAVATPRILRSGRLRSARAHISVPRHNPYRRVRREECEMMRCLRISLDNLSLSRGPELCMIELELDMEVDETVEHAAEGMEEDVAADMTVIGPQGW